VDIRASTLLPPTKGRRAGVVILKLGENEKMKKELKGKG